MGASPNGAANKAPDFVVSPGGTALRAFIGGDCLGSAVLIENQGLTGSGPAVALVGTVPGTDGIELSGCGEVPTRLADPFVVNERDALQNGKLDYIVDRAPERLCGLAVQVVDLTTCEFTNVITVPQSP